MLGIAVVLVANLHLHFFGKPRVAAAARRPSSSCRRRRGCAGGGGSLHIPLGPILYALLIVAIVAAVVVSIWWSTRLRRPAAPLVIEDVSTEELREAVDEGRAALAGIDDARAAIIACYVAMERRLADRGTARGAADTPDELLARAVAAGVVRGGAAGRLTALFYEARFSTHPLGAGQRDAASAALDELAAELAAKPAAGRRKRPGRQPGRRRQARRIRPRRGRAVAGYELAPRRSPSWSSPPSRSPPPPWPPPPWRAGPASSSVAAATDRHRPAPAARLIPRSAAQTLRRQAGQAARTAHPRLRAAQVRRRHQPHSRPMYESDLRPVLEHILAARLAETTPSTCTPSRTRQGRRSAARGRDAGLWPWIDPAQALDADERASQSHGIPGRTLSRLITRLEQL